MQSIFRAQHETSLTGEGFRAFPPEIREMIFEEVLAKSWNPRPHTFSNCVNLSAAACIRVHGDIKTPALIVALRGDKKLHREACHILSETNAYVLRFHNNFSITNMSEEVKQSIKEIKIDYSLPEFRDEKGKWKRHEIPIPKSLEQLYSVYDASLTISRKPAPLTELTTLLTSGELFKLRFETIRLEGMFTQEDNNWDFCSDWLESSMRRTLKLLDKMESLRTVYIDMPAEENPRAKIWLEQLNRVIMRKRGGVQLDDVSVEEGSGYRVYVWNLKCYNRKECSVCSGGYGA